MIYKIVPAALWRAAEANGVFSGAPVDHDDGFIHFSAVDQVEETAAKHFAGVTDLLLVAVEPSKLGPTLKWEVSRGGAEFPHLYGLLRTADVVSVQPLPARPDGSHDFAGLLP